MAAFSGRRFSLLQALEWELSNPGREVAGELLKATDSKSRMAHMKCHVGLLSSSKGVTRKFSCDVFSQPLSDGRLKPERNSARSKHAEAFCNGEWVAIVITHKVTKKELRTVQAMSEKYGVKIVTLKSLLNK